MQAKNIMLPLAEIKTFWQLFSNDPKASFLPRKIINKGNHFIGEQVLMVEPLAQNATPCMILANEQYKLLRTRVLQICRGKRGNVVLITSALAGDGKTLTAINLSYSLASLADKRILYVELDLRRPSAHVLLGLRSEPDARSFLEERRLWKKCIVKLTNNLDGLLAYNPSRTPNETLHKAELAVFLEAASREYDVVILDTAPLLAAVDTEAILPLVNNVVFLVRADKTPIDCVKDAIALVGEKIVGIVLNGTRTVKYEKYYYGYQRTE